MTHSEEFKELKKLYHENRYDILEIEMSLSNEEEDEGRIVFDGEDEEIELTGSSTDFIMALFDMKSSHSDGDKQFIDVSATPAGNPEGYYDLVEYFLDPPNENRREDAFERVQNGEDSLPDGINLEEALEAALSGYMKNPELKAVVENYHEVVAARLIYMRNVDVAIKQYTRNAANSAELFEQYVDLAGNILRDAYLLESPGKGYESFRERCITDTEFHLNKLRDIRDRHQEEMSNVEVDDDGRLDGFTAIPYILDQYARFYELVRDPLRDLAVCLEGAKVAELSDTAEVLELLNRTGHTDLAEVVLPELRNGAFHLSYELDESEGVVRIFTGRDKNRSVKAEYGFEELLDEYRFVQDAVPGIIFSYVIVHEVLTVRYLESPDFMFQVIEEADPSYFD
ncbi:hypothetical protein [Halomontanus rarus]|uniref:hypothetical protein n=1 Tax=Halomontanus rarus TaxID=3034020 RepID=UPI001A995119